MYIYYLLTNLYSIEILLIYILLIIKMNSLVYFIIYLLNITITYIFNKIGSNLYPYTIPCPISPINIIIDIN